MTPTQAKRVVVGLSGGVDSAVSAYLLKQQGYEVIGLFMQNWDSTANYENNYESKYDVCDAEIDFQAAEAVAKFLDIPLYRQQFIKEYWDDVFQYFLYEYQHNRTPNPDVLCNKHIKFEAFQKYALKEFNCDYIAMGHYAKIRHYDNYSELMLCKDQNKDQTYFLCHLSQEQLKRALFPLEDLTKEEVRELARKVGLPNAEKKDSTGICFIGERNFRKFLSNYLPNQVGDIVDITTNQVIGHHNGVMYYTLGQRKGLGLGGQKEKYFVCKKDIDNKILYVAPDSLEEEYLDSAHLIINEFNWITKPTDFHGIQARFRHRQVLQNVSVELHDNQVEVFYDKQKNIAPGQYCVLYQNGICLGGGAIDKVLKQ
ncbi:tRNA 2-thiouridine(34) synthase MnmA [Ureaplasma ceti]|uniref:tRNA-specific 2-thiouridylase MnmA n=1 Tax=Ureaplasma ceti TaxID=3119530 RepID=A0ABP9U808_9BACT